MPPERRTSPAVARPALICALLLLLIPGPSPSRAEFSPPRVAGKIGDGSTAEELRYYMDMGVDNGIYRGDVLNVYREKRASRAARIPIRLLSGRMTITDSQDGVSEGIFAVSDATIHHPLIHSSRP